MIDKAKRVLYILKTINKKLDKLRIRHEEAEIEGRSEKSTA